MIHLGEIVGDPAVNIDQNFSIKNNYENTVLVMSRYWQKILINLFLCRVVVFMGMCVINVLKNQNLIQSHFMLNVK